MIFGQDDRCRGRGESKKNSRRSVEILAPAGSYECFRAALLAGADAVYAGGPYFGARAYAENFSEEKLLEAIDEAHLHGLRFYLTVNTLIKDREIPLLYTYLEPLYRNGLDTVIVQDVGALEAVRDAFPGMDIHASTQMTITGTEGAKFLKECGAVRVVPARELSLDEIRHMKQETGMEVECFVHGALCYCYSGQCLMSSLIGGRSGNRGQCAQPCRLPYSVGGRKGHLLSLKDICTLELIPELIGAGIDSFKIEGRMKGPEYVAGVTSMYRKYVDLYEKEGKETFSVSAKDREMLMDLYNRGGFHTGYYHQRNGRDMISEERPGHAGVPAVKILFQKGGKAAGCALTDIHKGDVLSFPKKGNYTFGRDIKENSSVEIPVSKGVHLKKDCILCRTRNEKLLTELQKFCSGKKQEKIDGFLSLMPGKHAELTVGMGEISVRVFSGIPVERAEKSPLDETRIRKQLKKTGNTDFVFEQPEIELGEDVFLPMQQINEMRRDALEMLRKKICGQFHREYPPKGASACPGQCSAMKDGSPEDTRTGRTGVSVLVGTAEQLKEACAFPEISRLYVDSRMFRALTGEDIPEELLHGIQKMQAQGTCVYLALPYILREQTAEQWKEYLSFVSPLHFDGVMLRNYESHGLWKAAAGQGRQQAQDKARPDKNVILDQNLYIMNQSAKAFWHRQGIREFTVSAELNHREILVLGAGDMEMVVYGYLPVMVTAQCAANTVGGCQRESRIRILTDRYQNNFYVENRCEDCYNIIYNSVPLCLFDEKDALEEIAPSRFRLQFSVEDGRTTRRVLQAFRHVFFDGGSSGMEMENFTRGHFRRGVI